MKDKSAVAGQVSTHSRPKAAGSVFPVTSPAVMFQHTAARRRLVDRRNNGDTKKWFQHTAARRRLQPRQRIRQLGHSFNTQPPEGGCPISFQLYMRDTVSTHSRPKAAATKERLKKRMFTSFNTQPPEGGCLNRFAPLVPENSFNTQPPEGGWLLSAQNYARELVSTHSRPKAAGQMFVNI